MNRIETFQKFLLTQSSQIPTWSLFIGLILTAILVAILAHMYVKYGHSLSNRKIFARNFVLIAVTTMFIISVVKSSLALSLGLVGALSIIRFRTAIKEPEELAYLFLAISIGLGMGADQWVITFIAFIAILIILYIRHRLGGKDKNQNLYLTVSASNPAAVSLGKMVEILKRCCDGVSLKRFDETREVMEASFLVNFADFGQLNRSKAELKALDESVRLTFLDNQGIS